MDKSYCCPACDSESMQPFFQLENVPIHQHLLMPSYEAAQQCDRGNIVLSFCPTCGFVSNVTFEANRLNYSPQYENSQSNSALFREYMGDLAKGLIERYQLYNKSIIEIGCGKGEFLMMLCEFGHNRGIGFDPSYIAKADPIAERVTFIQDFYSEQYANFHGDLICCRHVLEHLPAPAELLASLRRTIKGDFSRPVIFFEVPNLIWILRNLAFWDIFYEHCSYFSPGSLARLFSRSGFEVSQVVEAFGGQYLWLEASSQKGAGQAALTNLETPQEVADAVAYFVDNYQDKMETLRQQLLDSGRDKQSIIWGAGAKGVTILNILGIPVSQIEFVVDINPRKQGKFIPGTGQQIVSPDFLQTYEPDTVFVMNPNYLVEIQKTIADLGIYPEIISL